MIVPAHHGGEDLRLCLESLRRAVPQPLEVLVISDGGHAEIERMARQAGMGLLVSSRQAGPASARNLGARAAKGEILLFVDSDVVVPLDGIGRVAELMQRHRESALFGSYDDAPAAANFLSQYRNLLHCYTHQTGRIEASTFWSAFGAIRREAFLAVGGFDENRYREPSIEDIELGFRLKRAGYSIRLCHGLQVQHRKRWVARNLLRTDVVCRAMPWTELLLQTGAWMDDLNLRWVNRISVALIAGLLLSAAAACLWSAALLPAAGQALGLLALNAGLYRFFLKRRGVLFALAAIPWHWVYLLCSGVGFAAGCLSHYLVLSLRKAEDLGEFRVQQHVPAPGVCDPPLER